MSERVEFEEVTIKVPRKILEFLRLLQIDLVEWIECNVVDWFLADAENMTTKQSLAERLGLNC